MTDAERELLRQTAAAVLALLAAVPDRSVDGALGARMNALAAASQANTPLVPQQL